MFGIEFAIKGSRGTRITASEMLAAVETAHVQHHHIHVQVRILVPVLVSMMASSFPDLQHAPMFFNTVNGCHQSIDNFLLILNQPRDPPFILGYTVPHFSRDVKNSVPSSIVVHKSSSSFSICVMTRSIPTMWLFDGDPLKISTCSQCQ